MMDISGKELLEVLQELGFVNDGLRGNHFVVKKGSRTVLIPDEDGLAEKTVLGLIDQAGLSSKDILKLLKVKASSSSIPSLDSDTAQEPSGSGFLSRAWNSRTWAAPLALYRVLIGIMFIISALEKAPWVPGPFGWYRAFLESASQSPSLPFVKPLVDSVLLPNFMLVGWLQYTIDLLIGLSLIIGLFTVVSAFLGTFWVIFFWMLAAGLPNQWMWSYIMWTASMMLFFTMRAGRSFGIDQAIARAADARKEDSGFWKLVSWLV